MPISCPCGDESEWYYEGPLDFEALHTKRSRKCYSCERKIAVGDQCGRFERWRDPVNDIEEQIHSDFRVPMAPVFMCEECTGLYWALDELGYCISLTRGERMRELVNLRD